MKKIIKAIVPSFLLNWYHLFWAWFWSLFYKNPSKKITLIGITGTKGKSSTIEITNAILEKAGHKTALSSSLRFKFDNESRTNNLKMTMPGKGFLQKFLYKALKNNCQVALIEVTSEGILQFREKFLDFDIKVFLNLQPEHLERHKGFENYKKAKGKFFKGSKKATHIINLDDKNTDYFLSFEAKEKIGFSLKENNPFKEKVDKFIFVNSYQLSKKGIDFVLLPFQERLFSPLVGEFNLYNILAAISIALSLKVDLSTIKGALLSFKNIPGRFEVFEREYFKVVLDYAHTPDSLEAVLKTIKQTFLPDYLICLSGAAGGGRDKWKRPKMGEILDKYCQKIILTNEDPYDENPEKIIEDIKRGIKNKEKIEEIISRREAIKRGIELVQSRGNSVFGVLGKGSETQMVIKGGKKIPWSDKKIIKEFL